MRSSGPLICGLSGSLMKASVRIPLDGCRSWSFVPCGTSGYVSGRSLLAARWCQGKSSPFFFFFRQRPSGLVFLWKNLNLNLRLTLSQVMEWSSVERRFPASTKTHTVHQKEKACFFPGPSLFWSAVDNIKFVRNKGQIGVERLEVSVIWLTKWPILGSKLIYLWLLL